MYAFLSYDRKATDISTGRTELSQEPEAEQQSGMVSEAPLGL
jgi:hypothetical protein